MTRLQAATVIAALCVVGCSGDIGEGAYDDAAFDDDAAEAGGAARDVGAREVSGTGGCEDPDRPGQRMTRACSTPCGSGTQTCADNRWTECTARQPVAERCGDGVDDDCDGLVDEDCGECAPGLTRSCSSGGATGGACRPGVQTCGADRRWAACVGEVRPVDEVCNGVDDDCDGLVDDGLVRACTNACGAGMQACIGGAWSPCSGRTPAEETCNGVDDDCDGLTDESLMRSCAGPCGAGVQLCAGGAWSPCTGRSPSTEVCNGVDDDCDGLVDESLTRACSSSCGAGTETCSRGYWTACSAPSPQTEVCDLRDNNCNGRVDEGLLAPITFTNTCRISRVFVAFGGCNVCRSTCVGYWVDPGRAHTYLAAQQACFSFSAFARTRYGDVCLTLHGGVYEGEVHQYCNGDCLPDTTQSFACMTE